MERAAESRKARGLLENNSSEQAFSYYQRLGRVQCYVLENYTEPLTLEDAARVAGMERTSFSAFFHRKTGICFRDWLAAVRVAKAMELMAATNLPVRKVGFAAGFKSVRTFERVFLKVTGQPPVEYKRSARPA